MRDLIYLASPYSHENPHVRQRRFEDACRAAAELMKTHAVFAPICHSHPIGEIADYAQDYDFWMAQDLPVLARCDKLIVLTLSGWKVSRGVREEMRFALTAGIPISYMEKV